MSNFDYLTKADIKKHNPIWPEIPDHPYRILIVGGSGSGKTNGLLTLINNESDTGKIYFYAKKSIWSKISIVNYRKRNYRLKIFKWFKSFY